MYLCLRSRLSWSFLIIIWSVVDYWHNNYSLHWKKLPNYNCTKSSFLLQTKYLAVEGYSICMSHKRDAPLYIFILGLIHLKAYGGLGEKKLSGIALSNSVPHIFDRCHVIRIIKQNLPGGLILFFCIMHIGQP